MSLNGISDFLYYYCFFPSAYASCWDQVWSQVPEFYHDLVLSVCVVLGVGHVGSRWSFCF